jgi:hypothetical protein
MSKNPISAFFLIKRKKKKEKLIDFVSEYLGQTNSKPVQYIP